MLYAFFGEVIYALEEVLGFLGVFFLVFQHLFDGGAVAEHLLVKASGALFVFHLHDFPDGVVVLVVRDIGKELRNLVVEPVFQQVDVDGLVFFCGVFEELGHVDRLAEVDHRRAAVAEVVAIFDGSGDDVNGMLVAKLLAGVNGDVEQAFAHAHQRVFGAMRAFGEEVEVDTIVDDIHSLVE